MTLYNITRLLCSARRKVNAEQRQEWARSHTSRFPQSKGVCHNIGVVLIVALVYVIMTVLSDVVSSLVDPRLRQHTGATP